MSDRPVWPGQPFPLGPVWDGAGVNFSLFSEHAERVDLCLFDHAGNEERIPVQERTAFNWHCYLPGIGPGQRYGYRVHGPWQPEHGKRFNPAKLLIDPYARAIEGPVDWDAANALPHVPGDFVAADLDLDDQDSAPAIPKCVVIDPSFDWEDDRPQRTAWNDTVIYEVHVKGFTMAHLDVREDLRGSYAGFASAEAVSYLRDLGVTAVELMPVHHIADERVLHHKGQSNYWGYSSIGYFAPHAQYAASGRRGEQVNEFKGLVKALHRADIEVILDVVYNHTAEGDHLGPMLSFKGIDNPTYYRLIHDEPRLYMNEFTGTGNSVNVAHPSVLRMIMDSLRYWVLDCHVDGFRFDLASALTRHVYDVDQLSAFLQVIHQDPVLSQVKLIAEPWDVGPGGYQVGNFPVLWSEWNGIYRDVVRDFWRGAAGVTDLAVRLAGSSDLYEDDGRTPSASVNFITAHDGFTLSDLTSYNDKHNHANQQNNQDGTDDNRSWNCGVEGPSSDPCVIELRARQRRNLLTTLLLSQGVPMLLGGDEICRTQNGNNNPWCQDNELSWLDWNHDQSARDQLAFTKRLIALRRDHAAFRRRTFLGGSANGDNGLPDAWWFRADGQEMTPTDWQQPDNRIVGLFLNGADFPYPGDHGEELQDDPFLLLINGHHLDVTFTLPGAGFGSRWAVELSTAEPAIPAGAWSASACAAVGTISRSLTVLRQVDPD